MTPQKLEAERIKTSRKVALLSKRLKRLLDQRSVIDSKCASIRQQMRRAQAKLEGLK